MNWPRFCSERIQDARDWSRGRWWIPRLPFLIYFAYLLFRYWGTPPCPDPFTTLNFGIHELGHFVFAPLGTFLHIAGGTILEIVVPIVGIYMFLRQRDYFAVAFGFGWLSTALFHVAVYCADARAMALPLAAPGVGFLPNGNEQMHDWHRMLTMMHMLPWDGVLAFLFRVAATLSMAICLVGGAWVLKTMARRPRSV